jgi:hypothetical protein
VTAPVPHGYPDWGRQTPGSDVLLDQMIAVDIGTGVVRGPFFVGANQYVGIFVQGTVAGTQVFFNFFNDQAQNIALGRYSLDIANGGSASLTVPVRGPWLYVSYISAGAHSTIDSVLWTAAIDAKDLQNGSQSVCLYSLDAVSIGASTTRTDDLLDCWPGWGYLQGFCNAASYSIRLYSRDFTGTLQLLDNNNAVLNKFGALIPLPPTPLRVVSVNGDAAARTLTVSLTVMPFGLR